MEGEGGVVGEGGEGDGEREWEGKGERGRETGGGRAGTEVGRERG